MIGIRAGLVAGINAGIAAGISANELAAGGGAVPLVSMWLRSNGQSNDIGEDTNTATGGSTRPSADYGYFAATPNTNTVQRLYYAQALSGSGAQTFVDTGTTGGQTYAPAGSVNVGFWRFIPEALQRWGITGKIGISVEGAVLGASLRRNLMPGATDGRGIFAASMARLDADIAIYGRPPAGEIFVQGETDASDATDAASYQANLTAYIAAVRAHLGNASFPFFITQLNPNLASASFIAMVRAAQIAVAAADSNVVLVSLDDYPLALTSIHYAANELYDGAERDALAFMRKMTPGFVGNLGSGPAPWLQGISAGCTSQASPNTASPRSGPDDANGDLHIMGSSSASTAVSISLTTAAGFTQLATFESVFSTAHRRVSAFSRSADSTTIAANNGHMPSPTVDSGANPLNVSVMARIRSLSGAPAIDSMATGVNNTNSTALTVAGGTTSVNNCLLVAFLFTGGPTNMLASIATSGLTWTIQRNSTFNPGSGVISCAIATAVVPIAGAFGATAVTFAAVGVNAGFIVAVRP